MLPGACAKGQGIGNKSFHLDNEPRSGCVCLASVGPLVLRASRLGAHSLKQPSLRALPTLFLGSHSPHIPWEFSFGLYEAEGLEKEGTEMPKVGWIAGSLLAMGPQKGSPRPQVTQPLKFLLWTSVSSSVTEGTMTVP